MIMYTVSETNGRSKHIAGSMRVQRVIVHHETCLQINVAFVSKFVPQTDFEHSALFCHIDVAPCCETTSSRFNSGEIRNAEHNNT